MAKHKVVFWNCFGDIVLENLKHNVMRMQLCAWIMEPVLCQAQKIRFDAVNAKLLIVKIKLMIMQKKLQEKFKIGIIGIILYKLK